MKHHHHESVISQLTTRRHQRQQHVVGNDSKYKILQINHVQVKTAKGITIVHPELTLARITVRDGEKKVRTKMNSSRLTPSTHG
jgi:hypothetical protein